MGPEQSQGAILDLRPCPGHWHCFHRHLARAVQTRHDLGWSLYKTSCKSSEHSRASSKSGNPDRRSGGELTEHATKNNSIETMSLMEDGWRLCQRRYGGMVVIGAMISYRFPDKVCLVSKSYNSSLSSNYLVGV